VTVTARLIDDRGAEASDGEFFRSIDFLTAEGVTHTLALGDELHLPVIVRPIEDEERFDAISPYGYPGARGNYGESIDPDLIDWSETELVSVFVRDRIGETCLTGGTLRNHVHVAEGTDGIRKRLREQIRRNERRGWEIRFATGPEDAEAIEAFKSAYDQTMARTGAADRYLYPREYFETVLKGDVSWLLTAARDGDRLAGALAVLSDGYLHYYLGGTADEALRDSPMKNLFSAMIELGVELGVPVSLGGGLTPGDSLDEFKRGFANGEAPFHTHELICDLPAYEELTAGSDPTGSDPGFFPAYRA
jgi:Acetyltransferase (GNAT) domain